MAGNSRRKSGRRRRLAGQCCGVLVAAAIAVSAVPGQEGVLVGPARAAWPVIDAPAEFSLAAQVSDFVTQIGQVATIINQVTTVINFATQIATNSHNIFGAIGAAVNIANMAGFQEIGGVNAGQLQQYTQSIGSLMTAGQQLNASVNNLQGSVMRLEGAASGSLRQLTTNPLGQSFAGSTSPLFGASLSTALSAGGAAGPGNLDTAIGAQAWTRQQLDFNQPGKNLGAVGMARQGELDAAALDGFAIGSYQMVAASRAPNRMKSLLDSASQTGSAQSNLRAGQSAQTAVEMAIYEELTQLRATDAALLRLLSAQALASRSPSMMGATGSTGAAGNSGLGSGPGTPGGTGPGAPLPGLTGP